MCAKLRLALTGCPPFSLPFFERADNRRVLTLSSVCVSSSVHIDRLRSGFVGISPLSRLFLWWISVVDFCV
jgi:hypothetical protein